MAGRGREANRVAHACGEAGAHEAGDRGRGLVDDLEFRVIPRRREPLMARASMAGVSDEADTIEDPVLRDLYKISRRKAQA